MRPLTNREYLALTLYGEARGESLLGRLAVASVIFNRLNSGRWGTELSQVVLAPKQFSCWNTDDPNVKILRDLGNLLIESQTTSDRVLRQCLWIADGVTLGSFESTVKDATHYYAASMKTAPSWVATGELVARVDSQFFYRKVA